MNDQSSYSVARGVLLRAICRHWRKAAIVFLLCFGLAFTAAIVLPRKYSSQSKLYLRMGRENVSLDPSATTGETVAIVQTLKSEVNSALEILKSREIANRVAEQVGVDSVLSDQLLQPGEPAKRRRTLFGSAKKLLSQFKSVILPSLPESNEERAIRELMQSTDFEVARDSSVIEITNQSGDPALSQAIVQAWTDSFVKEHLRLTRTSGSFDFFEEQAKLVQAELDSKEAELAELKSRSKLASVDGHKAILEDQLNEIRSRQLVNQSLLESTRAKLAKLQEISVALPAQIEAGQTSVTADAWNRMKEAFFNLQIREQQLKSTYSDAHPDVVAAKRAREEVEQILGLQDESSAELARAPNPNRQVVEQNIFTSQADLNSLLAEQDTIELQLAQILAEIRELNVNAVKIDELERERRILEANYRSNVDKLEQSRILESLENRNISSVNVLQSASFVTRPTGPKRTLIVLLGFIGGIAGGIGIAFIADYIDQSFVSAEEAELALDVPVLAIIRNTSSGIQAN